jgi:hypothetical protein
MQKVINIIKKMAKTKKETSKETSGKRKTTIDHDLIQSWVEVRDGYPARVKAAGKGSKKRSDKELLRIDFDSLGESPEEVLWEEFFAVFDDNNLAFLYEETTEDGVLSRFYKFIDRDEIVDGEGDAGKKGDDKEDAPVIEEEMDVELDEIDDDDEEDADDEVDDDEVPTKGAG